MAGVRNLREARLRELQATVDQAARDLQKAEEAYQSINRNSGLDIRTTAGLKASYLREEKTALDRAREELNKWSAPITQAEKKQLNDLKQALGKGPLKPNELSSNLN